MKRSFLLRLVFLVTFITDLFDLVSTVCLNKTVSTLYRTRYIILVYTAFNALHQAARDSHLAVLHFIFVDCHIVKSAVILSNFPYLSIYVCL